MAKRKQLIFDIDTKVAEQILGDGYRGLYSDIRSFLDKEQFEHIEGSAYMSKNPMTNLELSNILKYLKVQYPYLEKCVREIHQADISNVHSLSHIFEYDGTPGKYAAAGLKQQKENIPDRAEEKTSVLAKLKHKREEAKVYNGQRNAVQLENNKER